MRAVLLVMVVGCAPPPPPPVLPERWPTLARDDTYHTRVADLRTTLGRAGIALRTGDLDPTFATRDCDAPGAGGTCVRCELADERTRVDGAVFEATTRAFSRYPTAALEAARIDYVAICRDIVYAQAGEPHHPAGLADVRGRGMLISLAYFLDGADAARGSLTAEDIAHHELFHLLEYARMPDEVADDPQWNLHNPVGFAYGDEDAAAGRQPGFINFYAMTNPVEDRASVFQYLMASPDELCALARTDDAVRAKAAIIWRRVARLVDARFLRERARCVDWVE